MNRVPQYAFLSNPGPGIYLLNLKFEGEEVSRIEISKAQLGNLLVDGATMAWRDCQRATAERLAHAESVRLGVESLA